MMTDPIADMLTRIRNGVRARHETITLPGSKVKFAVAKVLEGAGYLRGVELTSGTPQVLRFEILYRGKEPVLHEVVRASKPGRRVYVGWEKIPRVKNGYGIAILSTPQGIMSGDEARKLKIGGEVIGTAS